MTKTIKFIVWASTGGTGSLVKETIEIDASEWEGMNEEERESYMLDEASCLFDWGYYKDSDKEES